MRTGEIKHCQHLKCVCGLLLQYFTPNFTSIYNSLVMVVMRQLVFIQFEMFLYLA